MNKGIVLGAVLALAGFGAGMYFAKQDQPPPVATTGSAGPSYAGGFKAEGDAAGGEGRCRERQHQGRGGAGG